MKGLLGIKAGMSQVYDDHGNLIPVTIIEIKKKLHFSEKRNC